MDKIDEKIAEIANQLALKCLNLGITVAVAESCTGGWLAKSLTDLAGSSEWFDRGFVTYSNEAKISMISVGKSTIEQHGAVSQQVVVEMARGVLSNSNVSVSVAISGIAGPSGGTEEKPVGLVWFAYARDLHGEVSLVTEKQVFNGDRNDVRGQAVLTALNGLLKIVDSK